MKKIIFILLIFLFSGCMNKKGITLKYYDECHTEYDMYGSYSEKCPNNIFNFKKEKKKDCLQCN